VFELYPGIPAVASTTELGLRCDAASLPCCWAESFGSSTLRCALAHRTLVGAAFFHGHFNVMLSLNACSALNGSDRLPSLQSAVVEAVIAVSLQDHPAIVFCRQATTTMGQCSTEPRDNHRRKIVCRCHGQESAFLWVDVFMYLPILVLTFYSFNQSRICSNGEGIHLQLVSLSCLGMPRILWLLQNSLTVHSAQVYCGAGYLMAVGWRAIAFRQDVVSRHFLSTADLMIAAATPVF